MGNHSVVARPVVAGVTTLALACGSDNSRDPGDATREHGAPGASPAVTRFAGGTTVRDTQANYSAKVAELVGELDGIEEEIRPLLNAAAADMSVASSAGWTMWRHLLNGRAAVQAEWTGLRPPSDRLEYHQAMSIYIELNRGAVRHSFPGFVERDGSKIAEGASLRDQGRAQLLEVEAALGTPVPAETR